MTKEDAQGDCFVPRKDGKSLMIHHFLNEGTTSPWFLQKPDDIPFPETKELKSIRHCGKTPEEKAFYFTKCSKGFSWQSSKACAPQCRKKTDKEIASCLARTAKAWS